MVESGHPCPALHEPPADVRVLCCGFLSEETPGRLEQLRPPLRPPLRLRVLQSDRLWMSSKGRPSRAQLLVKQDETDDK